MNNKISTWFYTVVIDNNSPIFTQTILPSFSITESTGGAPESCTEKSATCSGCACKKCSEFNEYAESNQSDGTFICYRCRKNL